MSDESEEPEEAGGHGVSGTQRGDSQMQEEPADAPGVDTEAWADQTETGGQATD